MPRKHSLQFFNLSRFGLESCESLCVRLQDGFGARGGTTCGCCDSRAAVFTNTWQKFVGKNNWAWRGVDTYSCLQGWNKDLTPAAVQHRHQLGLEPEKMSFTSLHQHRRSLSSTTMTLTPSANNSLFCISLFQALSLRHHFSPSSASTSASSSLDPFSPICSVSSHLRNLSSDAPLIFCQLFFPPRAPVSVAQ